MCVCLCTCAGEPAGEVYRGRKRNSSHRSPAISLSPRCAAMLLLDPDSQLDCRAGLVQAGSAVNCAGDPCGQSPLHLAASGGDAFCLLWLLQTGGDPNQQDCSGETPLHKAARAGSLECVSLLVASDARLDLCTSGGLTAEGLAWASGGSDCARFLAAARSNRSLNPSAPGRTAALELHRAGQKRGGADSGQGERKRARDW
ncbi:ankyrin repeat domain-containing protein 37 [Lepisosteus oculatus]|uniref:ankyrin repeat domain-containing protein 37 n=1 Tax=Lepisosteus oculatus TaxID=7918 RepID=UPI0035F5254B